MTRTVRTFLLGVVGLLAAAIATAWLLGPRAAERTVDAILHGQPPGLRATRGSVVHAGLGVDVHDVVVTGEREGDVVFRADSVRVLPSLAWPPVAVEVDGLRLSSAGAAAFARAAAASPGWAESARTFTKRQWGNLHASGIAVRVRDARITRGDRTIEIPAGHGAILVEDPMRARAVIARADGESGVAVGIEATQDAATLRLEVLAPSGGSHPDVWKWRARIAADAWRGFTDADLR